jgi:sn-glycerol 3-phosphate transport system substrate-binding protein
MKKLLSTVAVLLAAGAMVLTGCSKQSSKAPASSGAAASAAPASSGPIKVTLWHSMGGATGAALTKLVDQFNQSQSQYKVVAEYQGAYDDCMTKIKSTPKGQGPDLLQLYDIGTRWAIDSGRMLKMADFIKQDNYDISDYEPNILAYYTMDGTLWSMPFNCSSPVIVYNKEAIAKAGLDPTKCFATLDDVLKTCRAIHKSNPNMYGSMTNYSWVWEQEIGIEGADLLDNGNGRKARATKVIGQDALLKLFTKVRAIYSDPSNKVFGKGTAESKNQFGTGSVVGFIADSCSVYADMAAAGKGKFTVGFAPLPKVNASDAGGTSVGGGSLWILDSGSTDREKGAYAFAKFVTGVAQQVQYSMATGYIPVRKACLNDPTYKNFLANTNPALIVAIKALETSKPQFAGSVMGVFPKARVIIENEVERMANDKSVTPQSVVDNITKQIDSELKLYNETN